jgi:hypothetical protein
LRASEIARGWASELAAALAPLAKTPLPAIPGDGRPSVFTAEAEADAAAPARAAVPAAAPPVRAAPRAPVARTPFDSAPTPPPPPDPKRRRLPPLPPRRFAVPGMAAVAAIVVIVVLLVVLAGGGSPKGGALAAAARAAAGGQATQTRKLVLEPAGADRHALGAGAVVRQRSGSLLLLLQARGLTPNSHQDSYAVWLFNTSSDARLLGFVSPAVGAAGTFSSGVTLPDDAFRFHTLLVTLEQSSQPTSPGPAVLRTPLSLP